MRELRQRNNVVHQEIKRQRPSKKDVQRDSTQGDDVTRDAGADGERQRGSGLVEEARKLKEDLDQFATFEERTVEEMEGLAFEVPNLSSEQTPAGDVPKLLGYINGEHPPEHVSEGGKSHIDIGLELDVVDFDDSATTSGSGLYLLKNEGALLEQALVQYALSVAIKHGWKVVTPPSLVFGHIANACGFMPRSQDGTSHIFRIAQDAERDEGSRVLAGTAEIPLAGSQANKVLPATDLPLKVVGPSRCYRAEAGGGTDKGLYRVHEFTKVEMFAWTAPPTTTTSDTSSTSANPDVDRFGTDEDDPISQTEGIFEEILSIQTEILTSLGLHAKILEMPTTDLGAPASRKIDIEAFFPSRTSHGDTKGYGEVTSASVCTDYQSRRLGTRVWFKKGDKLGWPHTLNGTAIAVPRMLAALLENGWDEQAGVVRLPECLWGFMLGGIREIGPGRVRGGS